MKQTFSTHWISSTQPRKQRKYRYNAPLHIRGAFLGSHLAKDLREKYNTRTLRVRTGDEVKVMRGQYSGRTGKVERVDTIHSRVFVAGIDQPKRDGTKKQYPMQPSNLLITKVAEDKRRFPVAQKTRTVNQPNVPKKSESQSKPKQDKKTAAPKQVTKSAAKK